MCARCKKPIATASVECECNKAFHPGCIKSYSVTKYADACCKLLASSLDIPSTPAGENTVRSNDFSCMTAAAGFDSLLLPRTQSWSLSQSKLEGDCFLLGADGCSKSPSQMQAQMSTNDLFFKLTEQINALNTKLDAKLSAFMQGQQRINSEINDKLMQLNAVANTVNLNCQRIALIEQENTSLRQELNNLRSSRGDRMTDERNELVVSGLPVLADSAPSELIRKLFDALKVSHLSSHILSV